MKPTLLKILRWIPAILFMGLIFMLSHHPGEESGRLSKMVMDAFLTLGIDLKAIFGDYAMLVVRKTAHMCEYFIFFWILILANGNLPKGWKLAFFIALIYAATDEFHQSFVPGRIGSPTDVLVDGLGAGLGWSSAFFIAKIKNRKQKKP